MRAKYARAARLAAWPLAMWSALIFSSAMTGGPEVPGPMIFPHLDKVGHFFVFGLVATLVYRALIAIRPGARAFVLAVLVTSLFGGFDEWLQGHNPDRYLTFGDWMADTAGALVAVVAYVGWPLYRSVLEYRIFPRKRGNYERSRSRRADTGVARADSPAR